MCVFLLASVGGRISMNVAEWEKHKPEPQTLNTCPKLQTHPNPKPQSLKPNDVSSQDCKSQQASLSLVVPMIRSSHGPGFDLDYRDPRGGRSIQPPWEVRALRLRVMSNPKSVWLQGLWFMACW